MRWTAALVLLAVVAGGAWAEDDKVAPSVRQALARSRSVRVIVRLQSPDMPALTGQLPATRSEARSRLQRLRSASDAAFRRLAGALPRGASSCWLTGSVAVTADAAAITQLASRPDVKSVQVLKRVPCPRPVVTAPSPSDDDEWTWGLRSMFVPQIRELWGLTGKGVRIGHLDTGVAADHPDLKGKVLLFRDFTDAKKTEPYDPEGHGTHTAGTLVGGNASGRWIGVAPDAKLISARIFSADGADPEQILAAMQWVVDPDGNPATDDGAQIVSNSWGSDDVDNRVFWEAVQRWVELGVFPCFAAGNNGPGTVGVPAGYPHAFAVGAVTQTGVVGDFSSRGPTHWDGKDLVKPDLVAPGDEVLSASSRGNGYQALQGSSMACPHVAGLIALMLEARRDLKVDEIRKLLETTAIDMLEPGKDNVSGWGLVNPLAVMARLVPSGEVSGVVTGPDGQPVPRALVAAPRAKLRVTAGADGRFRLLLPPGAWTLTANAPGLGWANVAITVVAGQPQTPQLKLAKAGTGRVTGRVTSADEPRVLKARVLVPGEDRAAVETDPATGAFSLDLPEGRHDLVVLAPGFAPRFYPRVEVRAGAAVTLDSALAYRPNVLVVDDDGADLIERYYEDALDALGKTHTTWDTRALGDIPRDVLLAYPVVIWQTGNDFQTALTPSEQALVKAYLDSGGHLYFASQVGAATLRSTDFFGTVLHARYDGLIKREEHPTLPRVEMDGLSIGIDEPGSQQNQEFPTMIGPGSAAASTIATYAGTGSAAIRVDTGVYKVVYTGFGLEGISKPDQRQAVLGKILAFLDHDADSTAARVALADATRTRLASAGSPAAREYADTTDLLLDHARRHFLRTTDRPGVLSRLAARFGTRGVQIARALARTRE